MSKVKNFLFSKKVQAFSGVSALVMLLPSTPFATGGAGSQSDAVSAALQTIASDITATITAVAPVALGIVGIFLTWKYGMRFFKSISK